MRRFHYSLAYRIFGILYRENYRHGYMHEMACNVQKSFAPINSACSNTFSTIASANESSETNEKIFEEVHEEFREPKFVFNHVVNEAYGILGSSIMEPNIETNNDSDSKMWITTISMQWPEEFVVSGSAPKKTEAERIAYTKACQKLKSHRLLDHDNAPKIPHKHFIFCGTRLDNPKADLMNIYHTVWCHFGNVIEKPTFKLEQITGIIPNSLLWKCSLSLEIPIKHCIEAISSRSSSAEKIAAAKAIHWLYEMNFINKKKAPILYSSDDIEKLRMIQNMPCPVMLPTEIQQKMQCVLQGYKKLKEKENDFFLKFSAIKNDNVVDPCALDEMNDTSHFIDEVKARMEDIKVRDVFTEKPYKELTADEAMRRSAQLFEAQSLLPKCKDYKLELRLEARKALPIYSCREDILKLIEENRVVVIAGETGCGKTTQVPQYILESFVEQKKGAYCNIVVTQPRRISASTIPDYVAAERGEKVGSTVGYQIRLKKNLPKGNGAILFCTTGMFLRKLACNGNLEGVSHVIVDEVHERTNHIDFLLIIMRKLLTLNEHLKLILMSASIRTSLFSDYFDNCPVYSVPGKVYPVEEYFLDDIPKHVTCLDEKKAFQFDSELIVRVLLHVDSTQPKGAILCFLPGWHEIKSVQKLLLSKIADESFYMIYLLHSQISQEEQIMVFDHPPPGVRKIILATNIAETSITIDDVVYVIDSCFLKDTSFDAASAVSSIGIKLTTKANMRQRRGRAGRVQPGVCYHLITKEMFSKLDEYPLPEMHKTSLESVVLDCKVHNPDVKAEAFLSEAMEPPRRESVQQGVEELQMLGLLDADENLTQLGEALKHFATHPRLSKALVYGAFLGCLDPVLTICALLTLSREPFTGTLDQKEDICRVKIAHDHDRLSDHLSLCELFHLWQNATTEERWKFSRKHMLDTSNLIFAKRLKNLFFANLREAGFIHKNESWTANDFSYHANQNELVLAALTAAFYPNIIKIIHGEVKNGRLDVNALNYSVLRNNHHAVIQKDSVLADNYNLKSPWFIYFSGRHSDASRMTLVSALSCVQGLTFLIFAGEDVSVDLKQNDVGYEATLTIDGYSKLSFSCSASEAQLLLEWRQMMMEFFETYLPVSPCKIQVPNGNVISFYNQEVLPVLIEILNLPQVPFNHQSLYYRHSDGDFRFIHIPDLFE